ncbi:hypothetical protein WJX73_003391 [Symbiochloris irregularis]|uniref:HSF-type DNA-binding domain-containing protein n=1 Tax=Symbiochloris irregularis TaxID=706552 RepID=A0AAW1NQL7_9CHLO
MARRVANAIDQGSFYLDSTASQPPPFLTKTFDMVDDARTDDTVSWSSDGLSFVVWRPAEFARDLLPQHFKHNNFSSFVRQLNTYGFRKTDPDRWQFANEFFVRGRKDLLRGIHRRKTGNQPSGAAAAPDGQQQLVTSVSGGNSAIEVGSFGGLSDEVDSLRRDKNVLMMELVRLRQQQQASEQEIGKLHNRLEMTEQNQRHIMAFLTKAVQEPAFLQQVLGNQPGPQRITEGETAGRRTRRVKRRGPGTQDADLDSQQNSDTEREGQLVQYQPKDEFQRQFLELLGSNHHANNNHLDRENSPPGHTASSQDGAPKLEDVTDVNSAFTNMQLALPSNGFATESGGAQPMDQLSRGQNGESNIPMPTIPMDGPSRTTQQKKPQTTRGQDFEAFTANLASMLPKTGSQASLGGAGPTGFAHDQQSPNSAQASAPTTSPLPSPWSHPSVQTAQSHPSGPPAAPAASRYPLPGHASELATPEDFAMSLDMMQGSSQHDQLPDLTTSASQDPFRDSGFWEQWVRDAPDASGAGGIGPDSELFNRMPSSVAHQVGQSLVSLPNDASHGAQAHPGAAEAPSAATPMSSGM